MRLCGQTVPVEVGGTLAYSTREALGPVAIVTPWNFPFNVPCRKATPALMGGNTVVLKPASLTPRTGLLFTELLAESGLPPGVVNCVTGGGGSVGAALVGDARIKAISFTGSTPVGKSIQLAAARNLTPTQLELGGKNPAIVLPDADLDLAVAEIVKGAFACSGQWCTSTSRVIVLEETAAELTERLARGGARARRARRCDGRLRHGPRLRREAEGRHPGLHRERPRRGRAVADGRRARSTAKTTTTAVSSRRRCSIA